ncbi:hypothetical protein [uncultured Psychrobacter sp.]|uniref:hypothetical protein n=1 Tax=uncultured Psychrobacter sp. TaxID=259303 RepID=UPI002614DC17|nr:hypothetical protein [uncultured Psychrobacter sp.]
MNIENRDRVIYLISKLFNESLSEKQQLNINNELNELILDPKWSDYIFWSDDYFYSDGTINYDKLFKKIDEYECSEEYKYRKNIILLVNKLLEKDFSEKSEMQIVNELNDLLQSTDWMDYLFVNKLCLDKSGSLDEKCFLDMVLNR